MMVSRKVTNDTTLLKVGLMLLAQVAIVAALFGRMQTDIEYIKSAVNASVADRATIHSELKELTGLKRDQADCVKDLGELKDSVSRHFQGDK